MSGSVEDVTDENYEAFQNARAAVIVYGIASCEPCAAYDPIVADVARQFPHVQMGKAKMHVPGRCREIKKQHNFETYPTTHLYARGTLLLAREGKIEQQALITLMQDYFSPGTSPSPDSHNQTAALPKEV